MHVAKDHGSWFAGPYAIDREPTADERPAAIIDPPFDPATQYRRGPSVTLTPDGTVRFEYTVVDQPLEKIRGRLLRELADIRWQEEVAGTTLADGTAVPTDRTTQAKITSAYVKAQADETYTIERWKAGPGNFVTLDAATILAMGDAIEAHVQACFGREGTITDALMAKRTPHTLIEVWDAERNAGWPSSPADEAEPA